MFRRSLASIGAGHRFAEKNMRHPTGHGLVQGSPRLRRRRAAMPPRRR